METLLVIFNLTPVVKATMNEENASSKQWR